MSKPRVLVIDDDQSLTDALADSKELTTRFELEFRRNAERIMDLITTTRFDALLIDEDLGGGFSGIQLLESIWQLNITSFPENQRPGIIMITGKDGEVGKARELGIAHYLVKTGNAISKIKEYINDAIQQGIEQSLSENLREKIKELDKSNDLYSLACRIAVEVFKVDSSGIVEFPRDEGINEVKFGYVATRYVKDGPHQNSEISSGFQKKERITVHGDENSPPVKAEIELVENEKIINFSDLTTSSARKDFKEIAEYLKGRDGTLAILIVPIVVDGQVVASISIDSRKKHEFVRAEIAALEFLAERLGTVSYYKRLSDRLQKLQFLWNERIVNATTPQSLDALYETLVNLARDMMGISDTGGAGLYVYRPLTNELELKQDTLRFELIDNYILKYKEGASGKIISDGIDYIRIADYHRWEGRSQDYDNYYENPEDYPLGSVLAVRLGTKDHPYGTLFVYEKDLHVFLKPDVDVLSKLAEQAMMAIRLQIEKDRLKEQSNTLLEATRLLQSQPHVSSDDILHAILTGITSEWGLRLNRAILLLIDHTTSKDNMLVGREGIGFLTLERTKENWEKRVKGDELPHSFKSYWRRRKENPSDQLFHTDFTDSAKEIEFNIDEHPIIQKLVIDPEQPGYLLKPNEIDQLPEPIKKHFGPNRDIGLLSIPIMEEGFSKENERNKQAIGLILADNIATQEPISERTRVAAQTFASYCITLYRNVRRRMLDEVVATLQNISITTNSRDLLLQVADQALNYLNCNIVSIYTYNSQLSQLEDPPVLRKKDSESAHIQTIDPKNHSVRMPVTDNDSLPHTIFTELSSTDKKYLYLHRVVNDERFAQKKHYTRFSEVHDIKSLVVVLLKVDNEPIALMFLNYTKRHELFLQSTRREIENFSEQIALIVRSIQFRDRVNEAKHLRLFMDASRKLIARSEESKQSHLTRNPDKSFMQVVAKEARETINANIVSIYILRKDNNNKTYIISTKVFASKDGEHPLLEKEGDPIRKDGHRQWVADNNKVVSIEDLTRYKKKPDRSGKERLYDPERNIFFHPNLESLSYKAFICVPLPLTPPTNYSGVLWIGFEESYGFTDSFAEDVQIFANLAATAFINEIDHTRKLSTLQSLENVLKEMKSQFQELSQATPLLLDPKDTKTLPIIIDKPVAAALNLIKQRNLRESENYSSLFGTIIGDKLVFSSPPNEVETIRRMQHLGFKALDESVPKDAVDTVFINLDSSEENPQKRFGLVGRAAIESRRIKPSEAKSFIATDYREDIINEDKNIVPSQIAVPVYSGEHLFGILSIEHPTPSILDNEDRRWLETLANYIGYYVDTSIAIIRANAVVQFSKNLLDIQTYSEQSIFENVAKYALAMMSIKPDLELAFCHVVRRSLEDFNYLEMLVHIPNDTKSHNNFVKRNKKLVKSYKRIHLSQSVEGSLRGIVGDVMLTKTEDDPKPYIYVENVKSTENSYIQIIPETRSQLSVAMFVRGNQHPYGVINIEHPSENAFDPKDIDAIVMLAQIGGQALSQLFATQSNQALAWMGVTNPINRNQMNINLLTVQKYLKDASDSIQQLRGNISKQFGLNTPTVTLEKISIKALTENIRRYIDDKWSISFESLKINFSSDISGEATLDYSQDLLEHVLDILIDNALGAQATRITVEAKLANNRMVKYYEIRIIDNGKGIPPNIRPAYFVKLTELNGKQSGLSGISTRAMVEKMNGIIMIENSSYDTSENTVILIQLPIID